MLEEPSIIITLEDIQKQLNILRNKIKFAKVPEFYQGQIKVYEYLIDVYKK